jgi:hypothetical protein
MIEIFYISLSVIIFPILFSYPLNIFNYKFFFSSSKFTFFDLVLFNIVIHLIILLSFSFFSLFSSIFFSSFKWMSLFTISLQKSSTKARHYTSARLFSISFLLFFSSNILIIASFKSLSLLILPNNWDPI